MPYKRSSRISRHFWSPNLAPIRGQEEFFNSHGIYRQLSYSSVVGPIRWGHELERHYRVAEGVSLARPCVCVLRNICMRSMFAVHSNRRFDEDFAIRDVDLWLYSKG